MIMAAFLLLLFFSTASATAKSCIEGPSNYTIMPPSSEIVCSNESSCLDLNQTCININSSSLTAKKFNYHLGMLFENAVKSDSCSELNVLGFVYICCSETGASLSTCTYSFIEHCVNHTAIGRAQVLSCVDKFYGFCENGSNPSCREAIEDVIDDVLKNRFDSPVGEEILASILEKENGLRKFNVIKRVVSLLRGKSQSAKHAQKFLKEAEKVIEAFENDIAKSSSMIDYEDVKNLLYALDNAFNGSHISLLSSNDEYSGPNLLSKLKRLSKIFGRAILYGSGRIKSHFNFSGNNLDVKFRVIDKEMITFEQIYESENGSKSVFIEVPKNALCSQSQLQLSTDDNYTYTFDEIDDKDDIPDKFRNCFTVDFSKGCRQVLVVYHAHDIERSFEEASNKSTLVSLVVSVQAISDNTVNISDTVQLMDNVSLIFNITEFESNEEPFCCYWNDSLQNWSTDGMTTTILSSSQVLCTSNHLTSFAVLVDHSGVTTTEPSAEDTGLEIISYIGVSISIICLILSIILLVALRKQLQKGPLLYVHINLSLALLLALLVFVFGIELPRSIPWLCSVVAGLLHYLFLCVFCWSLAEGIMLYILIVRVYGSLADRWYLLLPLGWGLPIIIVGISTGIKHDLYGTDDHCWLSTSKGMIWSFIGPMLLIIIINTIFLIMTLYHIIKSRMTGGAEYNLKKIDFIKSSVKSVVVLLPLLSITWIIGVFTFNEQTKLFQWLFTIFNSIQGCAVLYFHVLRNKFITNWVKGRLRNKYKIKKQEPITSSATSSPL
ncbi:PREDICTED: adhesion G protein-coupled receptor E2-like isoform X2 [Amphimedon queenslandica]|uniref:G-protein coupled receptors family 2 profile 2 domain-containing protein n=1 Tax=Amphimedon queenslandica TaxID=400682 RepID=A0A1X7VJH0_AMPQE|nr:PREDICTED: adhesion G protein-coupled receptor E2-like isoform X2 [Amphimedon queenslandica]|eukprot:XP_019848842.1 PREDICTED: adhesion G protein-coupled receptor E2-like isoform X2 [Amphimedon queenslandica]